MNSLDTVALFAIAKHLENLVLIQTTRLHQECPEAEHVADAIAKETRTTSDLLTTAWKNWCDQEL